MSNQIENLKNELAALETKPAPDAQPVTEDETAMQITVEERDSYRASRNSGETLTEHVRHIRQINAALARLREQAEKDAATAYGEGQPAQ